MPTWFFETPQRYRVQCISEANATAVLQIFEINNYVNRMYTEHWRKIKKFYPEWQVLQNLDEGLWLGRGVDGKPGRSIILALQQMTKVESVTLVVAKKMINKLCTTFLPQIL